MKNMDIYIFLSTICCQSIPRSEKGPDMVYGIRYTINLNPQREVFQTFWKLSGTELWKTVISDSPNSKCGKKQVLREQKIPWVSAGNFFPKKLTLAEYFLKVWRGAEFGVRRHPTKSEMSMMIHGNLHPIGPQGRKMWASSFAKVNGESPPKKVDSDLMRSIPPSTLPETNIAPENGWLEYDRFLLGWPILRGELLVSGRVNQF